LDYIFFSYIPKSICILSTKLLHIWFDNIPLILNNLQVRMNESTTSSWERKTQANVWPWNRLFCQGLGKIIPTPMTWYPATSQKHSDYTLQSYLLLFFLFFFVGYLITFFSCSTVSESFFMRLVEYLMIVWDLKLTMGYFKFLSLTRSPFFIFLSMCQ